MTNTSENKTAATNTLPNFFYINGEITPSQDAKIHPLDRGFLFGDGVYEVCSILDKKIIELLPHYNRLKNSLSEIKINFDISLKQLKQEMSRLIKAEGMNEGMVYLQITRGVDVTRQFHYPTNKGVKPTFMMFCQNVSLKNNPQAEKGMKCILIDEIRWQLRHIKSTSLLGQVLGKQAAYEANAQEAWMVEDGFVTEATSAAAIIINHNNEIITRKPNSQILDSITRQATERIAKELQLKFIYRKFTPQEAINAKEAINASATALIMPVIEIDGNKINDGKPGPISKRLREVYLELALKEGEDI